MLRHPISPKGVLLIVLLDLFKVSKMSHFYYGIFKIGIMTYFNYDLFKVSKMCVLFFFVYNEIRDAVQQMRFAQACLTNVFLIAFKQLRSRLSSNIDEACLCMSFFQLKNQSKIVLMLCISLRLFKFYQLVQVISFCSVSSN